MEAEDRHFAGSLADMVMRHLERHCPPGSVEQVLVLAGENRSLEELCDAAGWSSYPEFRRLLEAAAVILGGIPQLDQIGAHLYTELTHHDYVEMLQSLGSPAAMYAEMGSLAAASMPVVEARYEATGSTGGVIHQRLVAGFEPFPAYCAYANGLMAAIPGLFGYPLAVVTEVACQCHGAAECVFDVTWDETDGAKREIEYLRRRVEVLEGRLEGFQRTVADLVSADDLGDVLERIVVAAARTVHAPSYLLAVDPTMVTGGHVYSFGIGQAEAETIAATLDTERGAGIDGAVVVEIASTRAAYGHLVAIDPLGGALLPQTLVVLEGYARLAAAALDSATALEASRREAATARVLLDLSSSLAEVVSTEATAAKIARAASEIIDCDRVAVYLLDPASDRARLAAMIGYPAELHSYVQAIEIPHYAGTVIPYVYRDMEDLPNDPAIAEAMRHLGDVAAAAVPVTWGCETVGWVTVTVTERPDRLRAPDLAERLRGLAGQAATAIRNARLLDQIRHEAFHDALTGLPNRVLVHDRVGQMLVRSRRQNLTCAVLYVDLDGFKGINDTLGHDVGDQVLLTVAGRLEATLRGSDTIGRVGGDEFIVLADPASMDAGPELVAERILDVLRQPITIDGVATPLLLTTSIGIAIGDREGAGELLRDADVALYRAKSAGKNRYVVFEPEMQTAVRDRLELEMDLRGALERHEYFLVYQPIHDLATGSIPAVEALLRWRHPTRGVVGPDQFIPILEETRLIVEVGRWVLEEACQQASRWRQAGHDVEMGINASAHQLELDSFVDDIHATLLATGMDPDRLTIEVTETAIMRDAVGTAGRLRDIKRLGVHVSIDDFGTGQSSLAHLSQFPVDALKIDRYFVNALGTHADSAALVRTLVQLGKALHLEIIAEGIETAAQAAHLRREGCDRGQGFLFARPVPAERIEELLLARRAAAAGEVAALTG